jgi:hypothetical protein
MLCHVPDTRFVSLKSVCYLRSTSDCGVDDAFGIRKHWWLVEVGPTWPGTLSAMFHWSTYVLC